MNTESMAILIPHPSPNKCIMSRAEFLAKQIREHGHEAYVTDEGKIIAKSISYNRNTGEVVEEVAVLSDSVKDVKEWLGY